MDTPKETATVAPPSEAKKQDDDIYDNEVIEVSGDDKVEKEEEEKREDTEESESKPKMGGKPGPNRHRQKIEMLQERVSIDLIHLELRPFIAVSIYCDFV